MPKGRVGNAPVRFGRPRSCPNCEEPGALIPMTVARGNEVDLLWLCRTCRHQWPVVFDEIRESTVAYVH
jgi:hypothetical protein